MKSNSVYDQYCELKGKYPDAILLFRTGDSYETYEDDAKGRSRDTWYHSH